MNIINKETMRIDSKLNRRTGILALVIMFVAFACDLEIEETDSIITKEAAGTFTGVEDPGSAVNNLYGDVYGQMGDQANFFALNEVSTDEQLVPTRGTDWGDNGIWRTLHAHTWTPSHQYILNVWNNLNQNVFKATEIIDPRSNATAQQLADAKFLRAFSMFFVMDFYGQVPFRNPDDGADVLPSVLTRAAAYDIVLQDLDDAIADLPNDGPGATVNRATQASARFLKAKLLLNKHIYLGGTPDNADMATVVTLIDEIEAAGFALQAGYFDLFTPSVDNETIWFVETSVGNRMWNGMHYNQIAPDNGGGGWNGFSTLAEFYDLFEGDPNVNTAGSGQEERRGFVPDASNADASNLGIGYGFLIGQQFGAESYDANGDPVNMGPLNDRAGNPLVFTKELPGLIGNNERTGIRVIKYHPVNGSFTGHEIVFRYADAHLMRAEALLRSGDNATALTEVNELRTLRNASALASISEDEMLAERGRELYVEFWRRNDMIRFGQYTRDWQFKDPGSVGDLTKRLYPIPSNALLSNPNLVQNDGY